MSYGKIANHRLLFNNYSVIKNYGFGSANGSTAANPLTAPVWGKLTSSAGSWDSNFGFSDLSHSVGGTNSVIFTGSHKISTTSTKFLINFNMAYSSSVNTATIDLGLAKNSVVHSASIVRLTAMSSSGATPANLSIGLTTIESLATNDYFYFTAKSDANTLLYMSSASISIIEI